MHKYGSPYRSNVGLIDGTFTAGSPPEGFRNVREKNRLDQRNFPKVIKAHTEFKRWPPFFSNGMIAMSDPFYGRSHDSKLMHESGWIRFLHAAAVHFGRRLTVFGGAAFGSSDVVQCNECLLKNVYLGILQMIAASIHLCPEFTYILKTLLQGRAISFRFSAFPGRSRWVATTRLVNS